MVSDSTHDTGQAPQAQQAQQAEAWRAVIGALLAHNPRTLDGTNLSGIALAMAEIKRLQQYDRETQPERATRSSGPTPEQLERRVVNIEQRVREIDVDLIKIQTWANTHTHNLVTP